MVTDAERLMVTDIEVILSATLFPVPKYNGTKANHITHVVYIVKPKREIRNSLWWFERKCLTLSDLVVLPQARTLSRAV